MATDTRAPLVSVNMPCYHQLDYARRSVAAILAQTFTDFELTLLDDGASDEYAAFVSSLGDSRVRYHRNPMRLGAMQNMFEAIVFGRGTYTLAFHEDDLMSRGYLAAAVAILERHPACAFVAGHLREFHSEVSPSDLAKAGEYPEYEVFQSGAEFLRGILRGAEPMFGSVVYRRAAVAGVTPLHDEFATLVDRPFLLSVVDGGSAAVIREGLVWYRAAQADDTRHLAMRAEHIFRLFALYKSTLPQPLSPQDAALFYGYSGYWLFRLYDLTPADARPAFRAFLFRAWREGLYQPRWRGRFGLRLIKRALLGSPTGSVS
ncbi:MAG: glycosyltransferase family 2 protein [Vicinamibacterales bacterium]